MVGLMKYISEILKQFTRQQRILVLAMLLTTLTLTMYFKTDDCSALVSENLKMHEDFVKISKMLREERLAGLQIVDSTSVTLDTVKIIDNTVNVMDEIMKIAESNSQK